MKACRYFRKWIPCRPYNACRTTQTTYIRKEDCVCHAYHIHTEGGLLKQGSMTAGQIGEHFDTSGATVSHHLTILRQAGLIEDRKSGKYIYYELNTTVFQEVLSWIQTLMEADNHEEDK